MSFYNFGVYEALIKLGVIDPETEAYLRSQSLQATSLARPVPSSTTERLMRHRISNIPDPSMPISEALFSHTPIEAKVPLSEMATRLHPSALEATLPAEGGVIRSGYRKPGAWERELKELEQLRIKRGLGPEHLRQIHGFGPSEGANIERRIGESAVTPKPVPIKTPLTRTPTAPVSSGFKETFRNFLKRFAPKG